MSHKNDLKYKNIDEEKDNLDQLNETKKQLFLRKSNKEYSLVLFFVTLLFV